MEAAPIIHGGNLAAARIRFPDAPLPWIDLSTGINPHPYSLGAIPDAAWHRLPEASEQQNLERVAAVAYGAGPKVRVAAAPGTQALIQLLPRLIPARRVAVLGFCYEEHAAAWRSAGAEVTEIETLTRASDADVAVVVNPNNPDGRLIDVADLGAVARRLAARGGTLVVDEAFMDVVEPSCSLLPLLPEHGAVVLRSFGKMYGLAGLRLGFVLGGKPLIDRLRAALGPWAVSGPALAIGTRALADADWRETTVALLRAEARRLDGLLSRAGLSLVGGTSLFRLAAHAEAALIHDRLGRAGILVRAFPARPRWLRFGLPADASAWSRLEQTLLR